MSAANLVPAGQVGGAQDIGGAQMADDLATRSSRELSLEFNDATQDAESDIPDREDGEYEYADSDNELEEGNTTIRHRSASIESDDEDGEEISTEYKELTLRELLNQEAKRHLGERGRPAPTTKSIANAAGKLLNTKYRLNWDKEDTPAATVLIDKADIYVPNASRFLDYICAEGSVGLPIMPDGDPQSLTFSLKDWAEPYQANRAKTLGFSLEGKTLKIAKSDEGNLHWFIVFHPKENHKSYIPPKAIREGQKKSHLDKKLAQQLTAYIKYLFTTGRLYGTMSLASIGVNSTWRLGGSHTANIDSRRMALFQELFIEHWRIYIQANNDPFWGAHNPVFHAYGFGQNLSLSTASFTQDFENYLNKHFVIGNLAHLSFALATDTTIKIKSNVRPGSENPLYSLTWNLKHMRRQFGPRDNYRAFPTAFAFDVGSFQSDCWPQDYRDEVMEAIRKNLNGHLLEHHVGDGDDEDEEPTAWEEEAVKDGPCQGYLCIKRKVRPKKDEFLLGLGQNTAAYCTPAKMNPKDLTRRDRLREKKSHGRAEPFDQLINALEVCMSSGYNGIRFEPIIDINVKALIPASRTAAFIVRHIGGPMASWSHTRAKIKDNLEDSCFLYDQKIYPEVMIRLAELFRDVTKGILEKFEQRGRHLKLHEAEALCLLERYGANLYTGNLAHRPTALLEGLGQLKALEKYQFPYFNPKFLDLSAVDLIEGTDFWPEKDGKLMLAQLPSLRFHYSPSVAAARSAELASLSYLRIRDYGSALYAARQILESSFFAEMKDLVLGKMGIRDGIIRVEGAKLVRQNPILQRDVDIETECRVELINNFKESELPFSTEVMKKVIDKFWLFNESFALGHPAKPYPETKPPTATRKQFCLALMNDIWQDVTTDQPRKAELGKIIAANPENPIPPSSLAPARSSWFGELQATVLGSDRRITAKDWLDIIEKVTRDLRIDVVPGPFNRRFSAHRFLRLNTSTPFTTQNLEALSLTSPAPEINDNRPFLDCYDSMPDALESSFNLLSSSYSNAGEVSVSVSWGASKASSYKIPYSRILNTIEVVRSSINLRNTPDLVGYQAARSIFLITPRVKAGRKGVDTTFVASAKKEKGELLARFMTGWIILKDYFGNKGSRFKYKALADAEAANFLAAAEWAQVNEKQQLNLRLYEVLGLVKRAKDNNRQHPRVDELCLREPAFYNDLKVQAADINNLSNRDLLQLYIPSGCLAELASAEEQIEVYGEKKEE